MPQHTLCRCTCPRSASPLHRLCLQRKMKLVEQRMFSRLDRLYGMTWVRTIFASWKKLANNEERRQMRARRRRSDGVTDRHLPIHLWSLVIACSALTRLLQPFPGSVAAPSPRRCAHSERDQALLKRHFEGWRSAWKDEVRGRHDQQATSMIKMACQAAATRESRTAARIAALFVGEGGKENWAVRRGRHGADGRQVPSSRACGTKSLHHEAAR